ncbi:glyoxalase [Fulvivirgaceae bacterium BMA10]|uniref:Glyoxalase n=1 Tax=Splendidivirga corallicola TaxID=3051826 RepID=A0ABT8KLT7_9BACT|nr:glyoxalase [Fulvivirgaceae bacterium BMA10]
MKIDPIIAVSNVPETSKWYQSVFDCSSIHGGDEFDVLVTKEGEIFICLHKWNKHDHPTMKNPEIAAGNGLILYFRTENMTEIRQNLTKIGYKVEREIQSNPNSGKREFSLRDPNGYYLTISEFHKFEG